jgi:signal transduction histidine kinase
MNKTGKVRSAAAEAIETVGKVENLKNELRKEKEISQGKSLFVNMVSHEMRTPLAIIRGAADLLEHCYEGLSRGERMNYIQSIKRGILRMTRTMDSVLILGKVQNRQLSFQGLKTDVVKFCANVAMEMEDLYDDRRIILETCRGFPHEMDVDSTLLYHIVSNLVSNGIKYSGSECEVFLRLGWENGKLLLFVKDFGIGIPENEIKNIYQLFYRCSNICQRKGIGIGMFIVAHCVALHGGKIEVSSRPNAGTTFKVCLPPLAQEY